MCAINPTHKKRFILDVYTNNPSMTAKTFLEEVSLEALYIEIKLNENGKFRWHLKETEQPAD